jgi:hypothetical protein
LLCPAPDKITSSYKDNGYTIGTVSDKSPDGTQVGPFDGWAYIATTTLEYSTVGLMNLNFLPTGPPPTGACPKKSTCRNFYQENARKKVNIAAWLAADEQHEGLGLPGNPGGGHAGLIGLAAQSDAGNVNKLLEPLFSPSSMTLETNANSTIKTAVEVARAQAASPSVIWVGDLQLWDPSAARWVSKLIQVGGNN